MTDRPEDKTPREQPVQQPQEPVLPPDTVFSDPITVPAYLVFGMLTLFAVAFFRIRIGTFGIETMFSTFGTAVAIAAVWPMVWNLLWRRTLKRAFGCMALSLIPATMFSGALLLLSASTVKDWHDSVPSLNNFVQMDFAQIDTTNSGKVTRLQLDQILALQKTVKGAAWELDRTSESLAQSFANSPSLAKVQQDLGELRQETVAQLRPDDQMQRIAKASSVICIAGEQAAKHSLECSASRDDLLHFESKLNREFPTWIRVLKTVGAL